MFVGHRQYLQVWPSSSIDGINQEASCLGLELWRVKGQATSERIWGSLGNKARPCAAESLVTFDGLFWYRIIKSGNRVYTITWSKVRLDNPRFIACGVKM